MSSNTGNSATPAARLRLFAATLAANIIMLLAWLFGSNNIRLLTRLVVGFAAPPLQNRLYHYPPLLIEWVGNMTEVQVGELLAKDPRYVAVLAKHPNKWQDLAKTKVANGAKAWILDRRKRLFEQEFAAKGIEDRRYLNPSLLIEWVNLLTEEEVKQLFAKDLGYLLVLAKHPNKWQTLAKSLLETAHKGWRRGKKVI